MLSVFNYHYQGNCIFREQAESTDSVRTKLFSGFAFWKNCTLKNKALTLNVVWFQRSISNERDHKIKVITSDKLQDSVVQTLDGATDPPNKSLSSG